MQAIRMNGYGDRSVLRCEQAPEPVVAASARPTNAYAAVEPQAGGDGFKDRWPQSVSNVPGASEWMAQQNGGTPGTPTVIYGNNPTVAASSYAATPPLKPHWLLSAFSPIPK